MSKSPAGTIDAIVLKTKIVSDDILEEGQRVRLPANQFADLAAIGVVKPAPTESPDKPARA